MATIVVQTNQQSCPVTIKEGLLSQAGSLIRQSFSHASTAAVVTDETVAALYGGALCAALSAAGFAAPLFAMKPGERHKNGQTLLDILGFLAENDMTRADLAVTLGGGVPGDAGGLAAALYMRGIPFVQVPTTLLAAVDASVGGKTAIDLPQGKNLAGAFHQPSLVLCDTDILRALPPEIYRQGMAEVIKCAMLRDAELFAQICAGRYDLADAVTRCVRIKADYVAQDERDNGVRQFLNLGHTFGHAVEVLSDFSISHGEAVALGLVMACRAAGTDEAPVIQALRACGLPTHCPYPAEALARAALRDKKRRGGELTLVLPRAIGDCYLQTVPVERLEAVFRRALGGGSL